MSQLTYDGETLRRYLLGSASAAESDRLDELSLTDDDCALALTSVENDLVDGYARATLSTAERDQFEQHYLASPLRRQKAQFAVELQRIASRHAAALPSVNAAPERRSTAFGWFNLPWLGQGALAAAALVILAVSLWLIAENRRLRHEISTERALLYERVSELETGRKIADANQAEVARLNERLVQLEMQPVVTSTPANAPSQGLFAFALAAPVRGTGGSRRIEIPNYASMVEVRLELESESYPRYRVALKDPLTGRVSWQSGSLQALKVRNGAALQVRLPASLFTSQRYAFEVLANAANNTEEPLASYPFEVSRP